MSSTRMFQVIVIDNRERKPKLLAYPVLNGVNSYGLMRRLAIRGFETFAVTKANGIEERLDFAQMAMIYAS